MNQAAKPRIAILALLVLSLLAACSGGAATPPPAVETEAPTTPPLLAETEPPTHTQPPPSETSTSTESPSPSPTALVDWQEAPVIPAVSDTARQIYQRGLEMGRDPHAFAKVGDCQNVSSMFLAIFQYPRYYSLGEEYAHLQETIDWFEGSWERESLAVQGGFNVASILSPVRADPEVCENGENPIECEFRLHNPSFALISMETWWSKKPAEVYEKYMRQIIELSIEQGVIPIITTKADNLEGDNSINATVVRLGYEYDIPVWNFWAAVQPLPDHGLRDDDFHLTFAGNYFDDPDKMENAWPWRNLTALQVLDAVRRGVLDQE